jgi:hypothetical protein
MRPIPVVTQITSARQISMCLVNDMMGMREKDDALNLCGVNPNNTVCRSRGWYGVRDRIIRGRPEFVNGGWAIFFDDVELNFEERPPVENFFVGDVGVWWGEFVVYSFFFVEGYAQNPADEGICARVGLEDLDSVRRPKASAHLLDVGQCNRGVFWGGRVR